MATSQTALALRDGATRAEGEAPTRLRLFTDIIAVENRFYILAESSLADELTRVLKHDETFAVFDHYGDIKPVGLGEEGLYHEGTRYLSTSLLRLAGERPLFLSSTVQEDNGLLAIDLTNPDIAGERVKVPRGTLHIARRKFLWKGACHERLTVRNYGLETVDVALSFYFEADFVDVFEVRGTKRPMRGRPLPAVVAADRVVLVYRGLDDLVRKTRLTFSPSPKEVSEAEARFAMALEPGGEATFVLTIECEPAGEPPPALSFEAAAAEADRALRASRAQLCEIYTSNEQFNEWLNRSASDLHMMTTETPEGPYPYAGVPWFSTAFGRDGIITALEFLWVDPALARGVLAYLAANQADAVIPAQDAEPGKILHETRKGEMAVLGEVPFGRYYGSVDATPLFVMLAGAYFERTGDRAFIESLWPNIERALAWIDTYGDRDGDGFVEYFRSSPNGLVQQGWKDSQDSVFHADGRLAEGPIALCEVQGYVYAAKHRAAGLAFVRGDVPRATELTRQAEALRERFERAFWCDDLGTYALALDGQKRPCRVRTSNAGHCLYTGIAATEHAQRAAQALMAQDTFSGWGVRTLSAREVRYNPMSYHNGSVWPHDNALVAQGLARYGRKEGALRVLTGLFDTSLFVDLHRLPELFCGFDRRPGGSPTQYPVACSPQSWASASVFLLLQACLGLQVQADQARISFTRPILPEFLKEIRISSLKVAQASVDLILQRHGTDVGIDVLRRDGEVEIAVFK